MFIDVANITLIDMDCLNAGFYNDKKWFIPVSRVFFFLISNQRNVINEENEKYK